MMNAREERINALNAAGIDTGKFVAMNVPEGATIIIATPDGVQHKYDRNGNPIDELLRKVKDVGYIKEDPHFRRWVTAQTFHILDSGMSMERYINMFKGGYYYQFSQTLDELNAIAKMGDTPARNKRTQFFSRSVVIALCEDYLAKLHAYVDKLPTKSHHGIPYKKIKGFGVGVHCKDIEGVVFSPLERYLNAIKELTYKNGYYAAAREFKGFVDHMVKIDLDNAKLCEKWVSAYKGAGAYYTLMGLIKFHGCRVYKHYTKTKTCLSLDDSIMEVEQKVNDIIRNRYYSRTLDWYLLYGMLKEVISDNNFNFRERMKEVYGK